MKRAKTMAIVFIVILGSNMSISVIYSAYIYIIDKDFKNKLIENNLAHYLYFNIKPKVTIHNRSQVFENYTIFNIIPYGNPAFSFFLVISLLGQIAAVDIDGNVVFRTYGYGYRGNIRIIDQYRFYYELFGSLKIYDTRKGNKGASATPFKNHVTHDFVQLPNGNVLKVQHYNRKVGNKHYDGNIIVETNLTTKEDVWIWNAWDFFDLSENCSICINLKGMLGFRDWMHMNALSYNESEDTIIANMRNLNKMIKINHSLPGSDPNSLIWMLGGQNSNFTGSGNNFSHAHGCEIINGTSNQLITFDNGLHRSWGSKPFSRVLIIEINETDMTAEIVWNYKGSPEFYSTHWSYAEQLPNKNILITDGVNGRVIEVNYTTQEIVWEMQLPKGFSIYRAYRIQLPFDFIKTQHETPLKTIFSYNLEIPYVNEFYFSLITLYIISIMIIYVSYKDFSRKKSIRKEKT